MFNNSTFNPQFLLGIFFAFFACNLQGQKLPYQQVFKPSEKITYSISYNWGMIWVDAGVVDFTVNKSTYNGTPAYRFQGKGNTLKKWDWLYRVRDTYTSYTGIGDSLKPLYFQRNVQEGSTTINNFYRFEHPNNNVKCLLVHDQDTIRKVLKYSDGITDVITMIYQARLIDFENIKTNDKIPLKLILDGEIHETYIRYLGIELIELDNEKFINCYKFKPLLVEGTIFRSGEGMTVWVSADANRVPVLVETPILVGSIKAYLRKTQNLIRPLKFVESNN